MEEEIQLEDYLRIINRWKWPIAICGVIAGLSAMFISLVMTPTYQAETTLYLGYQPSEIQALSRSYPAARGGGITYFINTYSEIIRSRKVLEEVIKKFDLEVTPENMKGTVDIERVRDSNLLKVKFQHEDPEKCADILNYLIEVFMGQSKEFSRTSTRSTREFIETQIETFGKELKRSEEELQRFKEKKGIVVLSEETTEQLDKIAQLVSLRITNEIRLKETAKRLEEIDRQLSQLGRGTIVSLPQVEQYKTLLKDLETRLAQAAVKGDTKEMAKLEGKIGETKQQLNEEITKSTRIKLVTLTPLEENLVGKKIDLETEKMALSARQASLDKVIDVDEKEMAALPEKQLVLSRLERKVSVNNRIYTMLQERFKEAQIKEASEEVSIRVVDRAIPPEHPIKPKKKLNTLIGGFLGLLLGGGMALVREYVKGVYKDEIEIEKELALPVLGSIPLVGRNEKGFLEMIIQKDPHSLAAEAYLGLVTRLSNISKTPLRSILITSSLPQEGKSFNVVDLGLSFVRLGKKVLIIDADLRRPVLHKIFAISNAQGFSDLLKGRVSFEDIQQKPPIENLEVIPSGEIPSDTGRLLSSLNARQFFEKLKEKTEADIILLDSPPVFSVADPVIISPYVDGVILIHKLTTTPRRALERTKNAIESAKGNLVGIICNRVPTGKGYYSYYKYHHYDYKEK